MLASNLEDVREPSNEIPGPDLAVDNFSDFFIAYPFPNGNFSSMAQPSVCKCCGGPLLVSKATPESQITVCNSCLRLMEDVQDSTVIESAIPYEIDEGVRREEVEPRWRPVSRSSTLRRAEDRVD
jgi:hypothetical protein